jgi:hypothetical protein
MDFIAENLLGPVIAAALTALYLRGSRHPVRSIATTPRLRISTRISVVGYVVSRGIADKSWLELDLVPLESGAGARWKSAN